MAIPSQRVFLKIKGLLKAKQLTYKDLANTLKLSESSMKRIFSSGRCQLQQFHQICDFLGVSPYEIYSQVDSDQAAVKKLTKNEESVFAQDLSLFYFFRQLCFHDLDWIREKNQLTKKSISHYLSILQSLNFVKINSKNKVSVVVPRLVELQKNGVLQKLLMKNHLPFILDKNFENSSSPEHWTEAFSLGLTEGQLSEIKMKLLDLKEEAYSKAAKEKLQNRSQKGFTLLFLCSPYRIGLDGIVKNI